MIALTRIVLHRHLFRHPTKHRVMGAGRFAVCSLVVSSLAACGGDGAESGCSAVNDEYGFTEETSLGYSMSQTMAGDRRGATAELSWADSRDWLEHSAGDDTDVIVRLEPSGGPIEEIRNSDTDCFRVLRTDAAISLVTEDGQLEFTVDGTVTAFSRDELEVEADVEPSDLEGILQVSSDVSLRLHQTIDGNDVEGVLVAFTSGESTVKTVDLATWQGSTGAPPPPEQMEPDGGMPGPSETDPDGTDTGEPEADSGAPTDGGGPVVEGGVGDAAVSDAGELEADAATGDAATVEPDAGAGMPDAAPAADAGDAG